VLSAGRRKVAKYHEFSFGHDAWFRGLNGYVSGWTLLRFSPESVMPAFFKIDKERRIVMTTASGAFTLDDALDHQQRLRNDPEFDPSFSQLLDLTHVSSIEIGPADVRRLAEENLFSSKSRRAILVNSDLAFGLARIFEVHRESAGESGINVFRDLDEALDWILAKSSNT
jgi:hypothetical protein